MKYCQDCLQPDTRPNAVFTSEGICPACHYSKELKHVDWQERYDILQGLISDIPKNKNSKFDCIIGVSGGKDSIRQALYVRDKLGLNPLLACLSYPPEQITQRGVDNISRLINLGFDCVTVAPAPQTWRKLMGHSFEKFTNWARSTELALYGSVPQLAIRYEIPLIFWGENPALQVGDLNTLGRTGYDGNNLRNMNTLSGGALDWIKDMHGDHGDLMPYLYPTLEEFERSDISIVYLGWFWADWSFVNNAVYSCLEGLNIRVDGVENTGDLYGVTALDEDWVTLNQMIKYYKYGFGRVTDYVNEEIRLGTMTREHAIILVKKYDGSCGDAYIKSFCNYIGIGIPDFWEKVHSSINTELFSLDLSGKITRKFEVGEGL